MLFVSEATWLILMLVLGLCFPVGFPNSRLG